MFGENVNKKRLEQMFDVLYNSSIRKKETGLGGNEMKRGETICYYRARGGEKNIYVTMLYHKDKLRGSIIANSKQSKVNLSDKKTSAV